MRLTTLSVGALLLVMPAIAPSAGASVISSDKAQAISKQQQEIAALKAKNAKLEASKQQKTECEATRAKLLQKKAMFASLGFKEHHPELVTLSRKLAKTCAKK